MLAVLLGACGGPRASLRVRSSESSSEILLENVPFQRQRTGYCGPAALASLLSYWGKPITQEQIGLPIYSPALKGTLGYDLWRFARQEGFVALELKNVEPSVLHSLIEQGIPVILNLDFGFGKAAALQHYVLLIGHDAASKRWIFHDGRRAARAKPEKWLLRKWEKTGRWTLVAFPPDRRVTGLNAEAHVQAANRMAELKKPDLEAFHLEQALNLTTQQPRLWFRLGLLYHTTDTSKAETAYRKSIELEPSDPDAHNNLALLLLDNPSRLREAEMLARRAAKLCTGIPNGNLRYAYTLDTLGQVLRKQGQGKEAARIFRTALSTTPSEHPLRREILSH